MNERIRDLGTQAGLYVDLNGTPWPRAMSAEECEAAYKKFAELIVRECVNICYRTDTEYEGHKVKATVIASKVAEHFGVEL
jgi:hypothetical protein